jgi:quercetin dioxygenase-like cupin family protein
MKPQKTIVLAGIIVVLTLTTTVHPAVMNILAAGTTRYSEVINGPATLTFRQLLMDPNEVSGWHYHPGTLLSVVKRGSVTVEDGCGGEDAHGKDEAFEAVGERIHRARAGGDEQLEELNLFITPQGMTPTVQVPERRCGPPVSRQECRHNGWRDFDHPRRFGSQAECVQFVRRRD